MFEESKPDECSAEDYSKLSLKNVKDLQVQLVLSLILGSTALLAFCILRPRWPSLYSARKRRLDPRIGLPTLTSSFFGWIPQLYRVSEEQVLASAGLDAFVFLTFFKMAARLFATMGFLAITVLWPINIHYRNFQTFWPDPNNGGTPDGLHGDIYGPEQWPMSGLHGNAFKENTSPDRSRERTYLWAYVVFTYFFVGLTIHSINLETFRIIGYRQDYLGSQSTVTDRTFRLTGIPPAYRSESRIRTMIEKLNIGKVTSVLVCRDWSKLDDLVEKRDQILRKLESAWATYLKQQRLTDGDRHMAYQNGNGSSGDTSQETETDEEAGESTRFLNGYSAQPHISEEKRPQIKIWYGFLGLWWRKVDAIDYYEELLGRADDDVIQARKQEYAPTDMVLVTMDSVASCQMVTQARIDARPGRFLTKAAPSPSDLVWRNTYERRGIRRLKGWLITVFVAVLTLVWIFPTAFLASWLSVCTLKKWAPALSAWLESHTTIYSLFRNGLPTLVVSFLNFAVPYLYDWLSNHQGMISHGDVELSLISKNFFFTFFNTFFVFAVSLTGLDFWVVLRKLLRDTSKIPAAIAADVETLSIFYINFIMLQGIGLMPFRILEVGSVFLFPINRFFAKTPRDYSETKKPPVFQYGFFLPTSLLVFNLCLIYSVLQFGWVILLFGTLYFVLGYFTFKYMVLYAMDQPQHATGGAWQMICYRIVIGLLVFQVVMIGQIASLAAFVQSVTILPLIPFTIWYSYYFKRRFVGLMKYIALRAIRMDAGADNEESIEVESESDDDASPTRSRSRILLRRGSTLDELKERDMTFINPSLISTLQQPWIYKDPPPLLADESSGYPSQNSEDIQPALILPNAGSSMGFGDDNVWLENNRRGSSS